MVTFELGPKLLRDDQGRIRVVLGRPYLAELLAIRELLQRLREAVADQHLGRTETAELNTLATRVEDALEGRW